MQKFKKKKLFSKLKKQNNNQQPKNALPENSNKTKNKKN